MQVIGQAKFSQGGQDKANPLSLKRACVTLPVTSLAAGQCELLVCSEVL